MLIALASGRPVRGALLAAGCALVLAACGGAGRTGYHNPHYPYGAPNVPISMSKCMRANGVPDFPDPREGPNGGGVGRPGGGPMMISTDVLLIMGQRIAGPAVASAAKNCKEYMGPTGPPPALSESQRKAAIGAGRLHAHPRSAELPGSHILGAQPAAQPPSGAEPPIAGRGTGGEGLHERSAMIAAGPGRRTQP